MSRRMDRFVMWMCLAILFGGLSLFEYRQGAGAHTPVAPQPPPAGSVSVPPASSVTAWSGLLALDGLEGEWVGERAPEAVEGGALPPSATYLKFDATGSRRRWNLYASMGVIQLHCSLAAVAQDAAFPGICTEKGVQPVYLRFSRSSDGRLSFDNYSAIFRRP